MLTLKIVRWSAEECKRQGTDPIGVADMLDGWIYLACLPGRPLTATDIKLLGLFVEPEKNRNGYAIVPRHFGDGTFGSDPINIAKNIDDLLAAQSDLSPEEIYQYLEKIHPFIDGNGRVGSLIYNYFSGTLHDPKVPPEYHRPGS